jgi:tetratricopeptide (TPR) repeat protein
MATKNLSKEEKLTAEEKLMGRISGFFHNNRLVVIIISLVVVVGLLASIIIVNAVASSKEKAQEKVAQMEEEYFNLAASENPDWTALESDLNSMVKGSSYASVKSAYLLGLVYYEQEKYADAQAAFEKAYNLNKKAYLASSSLVNAAAAAEAQGDTAKALELYNQVYNDYQESGVAPKALFNAARIYMQQGNTQLATATFAQVADYYPSSEYGLLAKNLVNVL